MTRDEMVERILEYESATISVDDIEEVLYSGFRGYKNMTDQEIATIYHEMCEC